MFYIGKVYKAPVWKRPRLYVGQYIQNEALYLQYMLTLWEVSSFFWGFTSSCSILSSPTSQFDDSG